jgi:hypothetical protein
VANDERRIPAHVLDCLAGLLYHESLTNLRLVSPTLLNLYSSPLLSRVESYITTDGQSPVCLGIKHPSGAYDQIFISQTIAGLLMWGSLSDERTVLSFTIAAGPRQRSHSRVRVPLNS